MSTHELILFGGPFYNDLGKWRHRGLTSLSMQSQPPSVTWQDRAGRRFHDQIAELRSLCTGRADRTRLARLISSLSSPYRGASESAHAELDLAIRLIQAGFRVGFLPESQSRTADLECVYAQERVFVEITAMVGSPKRRLPFPTTYLRKGDDNDADQAGQALTDRIRARISQKAKQLADYCAPVVLAISMLDDSHISRRMTGRRRGEEVDLKRLSGAVILTLLRIPHVSAVLVSLWNVEPAVMKSGIRLAHVSMVERPRRQNDSPRVRMLVLNPAARSPLSAPVVESLKSLL